MAWIGGAIAAAGSLIGGLNASDASSQAANIQAQSGQAAIAETQREFDIGQANLAPYRNVGQSALYTLADYLGLSGLPPGASAAVSGSSGTGAPTRDQFTTTTPGTMTQGPIYESEGGWSQPVYSGGSTTFDQAGFDAATAKYNASQAAQPAAQPQAPGPNTGSLLKPFSFNPATDPGYNAGLNAGFTGINNSAAAAGSALSGATLKELLAFGQQYAGTQQQIDFSQDQAQKASTYGMLTGTAGMGQNATTTGVQAGANTANSIANTLTGIGNAQASGIVGGANALSSGLNNAANSYNQNQLLSSILKTQNPGVANVNAGVNLGGAGLDIQNP